MIYLFVKQMLKEVGLKMSLVWLKVIDVFWEVLGEQGWVLICILYWCFFEIGMLLFLVSICQVFGCLVESGLVIFDEQDVYSFGKVFWGGVVGFVVFECCVVVNEQWF